MEREQFQKILENNFNKSIKELEYFFQHNPDFAIDFAKWVTEACIKNVIIAKNKNKGDKERARRRRARVYWIDFGVNIGSEFNYPHFCVVIKESLYTAIIVPISTIKETTPEWKNAEELIVDIGCIEGLPGEKKPCYALVHQIKTVSKQRLSNYKYNQKYYDLRLNNDQMNKIDEAVKLLCKKI